MGKLGTAISYRVDNQGGSGTGAVSGVTRIFAVFILGQFFLKGRSTGFDAALRKSDLTHNVAQRKSI